MTTETAFTPETDATHYGIPVCHIGEDGDMLALGHPGARRALAAFNRHARAYCGLRNLADDQNAELDDWLLCVDELWVIFRRPDPNRGDDPDFTWYFDRVTATTPGAQPVTYLDAA